jgi:DNA-binding XRE family transcriptional regulator
MKYIQKPLRDLPRGLPKISDRIEYIRCVLGYTPNALALKTGSSKVFIRKTLMGGDASMKLIQSLLKVFPVNESWLFLGTGEPFKVDDISDYIFTKRGDVDTIDLDVAKRIKEVRIDSGLTVSLFADSIKATKDMAVNFETGRTGLSVDALKKIIKAYNVNDSWILWGIGNKYKIKKPS